MAEKKNPSKMLIFDYDRTLTLDEAFVPAETKSTFGSIVKKNVVLGIVSGRNLQFLKQVNEETGHVFSFLVAENGAITYLAGEDITVIRGRAWTNFARKVFHDTTIGIRFFDIMGSAGRENYDDIKAILAKSGLKAELESNKDSVMVLPPNVNKGIGISTAISHYQNGKHLEVTCFGDGENDLSMFASAQVRVAVSNAVDELKNLADVVTDRPGGLGVSDYLKARFLQQ